MNTEFVVMLTVLAFISLFYLLGVYLQWLQDCCKEKILERAKSLLSKEHLACLEKKLEEFLPAEVRKLSQMPDTDFGEKIFSIVK